MKPRNFYEKRNRLISRVNKKRYSDLPPRIIKIIEILSEQKINRFLDIGCGDTLLSKYIISNVRIKEYYGIDITDSGVSEAKKLGIIATKLNIDETDLPYENNYFDCILAGELIEHLFDPDHFLTEVYRVIKKNGSLVITTPNLASWHNRIAILLGYQPHYSEVSTKYNVGKLLATNKHDVSGHIRLFTLRALRELLEIYKFRIARVFGYGTNFFLDKYIFNFFPSLSTGLIIMCRK